jgi:hypothetical protein
LTLSSIATIHLAFGAMLHKAGLREPNDLTTVPHVLLLKLVLWPFFGRQTAEGYAELALRVEPATLAVIGFVLAYVLLHAAATVFAKLRRDETTMALVLTYLTAVAAYALLGLGVGRGHLSWFNAGRYAWLPNALLFLLLAHQLEPSRPRMLDRRQLGFGVALVALFVTGIADYRLPRQTRLVLHGASWRGEVRRFREDPEYRQLRIAPIDWVVDVPAERRLPP